MKFYQVLGLFLAQASLVNPTASMSADSLNFVAPDTGPGYQLYTCSFHWFKLANGSVIGLDVIRSSAPARSLAPGRMALRFFEVSPDGKIRALIQESSDNEWTFATQKPPSGVNANQSRFLGRAENWVGGSVNHLSGSANPSTLKSVAFDLQLSVLEKGHDSRRFSFRTTHLDAIDFLRVKSKGWVEIDGVKSEVVDSEGPAAIHLGASLPSYAYLATLPGFLPQLVMGGVARNNLRIGTGLFPKDTAILYSYRRSRLPSRQLKITPLNELEWPLSSSSSIRLSDVQPFPHQLLDVDTVTATARATITVPDRGFWFWTWQRKKEVDLGMVVLDFRGDPFVKALTKR